MSAISIRMVRKTSFYTIQYKYATSVYYKNKKQSLPHTIKALQQAATICFFALSNWTNPMADFLKLPQLQLLIKLHHSRHHQPPLVAQKLTCLSHQLLFSPIHMSPLQQPNGTITPTHLSSLQQPLELPIQIKSQLKNQRFL